MISSELFNKIKKFIHQFFELAEIQGSFKVEEQDADGIRVTIQTDEAPILIGEKGETLLGLQSLLKKMLSKQFNQRIFVELDINDYRAKKTKYLEELAVTIADEVSLTLESKSLEPMDAWERRIIHMVLSERQDVTTESQGRDWQRHIIISLVK